jgi:hypothetical protein
MLLEQDKVARSHDQRYNLEIIRLLEEINNKLSLITPQDVKTDEMFEIKTEEVEETVKTKPSRRKKTEVV